MNPIQLFLILGGGYMLYRYYTASTAPTTPTPGTGAGGATITPGNNGTGAGAGSGAGGGSVVTPPPPIPPNPPANVTPLPIVTTPPPGTYPSAVYATMPEGDVLALAAAGNEAAVNWVAGRGTTLNIDQWNYYREAGGRPPIDPSTMDTLITGDRAELLTITQYRQRLAGAGLSGLGMGVGLSGMESGADWVYGVWA